MKAKPGVILAGLNIKMRKALIEADAIWRDFGVELVITSALDGCHSAGSLHPYGFAVDCRTNYFDAETQKEVAKELKARLGSDYDVVVEVNHIHLEFDAILRDDAA